MPVHRLSPIHTSQRQCYDLNRPSGSGNARASLYPYGIVTKDKPSLDITQRIERKLAEYNTSQNIFKRWLFEIFSWCLSALCMTAIVGIYVHLKDKPLYAPDSGLLLTLANVFGKIASAALIVPTSEALGQLKWNWFHDSKAMWDFEIFDKASRGPWGAVMLLFRTRGRSLAALGALLIVLLLAIDTFFQQVVELPERWSLQNTTSTIPRSIRYDPGLGKEFRSGFPIATHDPDLFQVLEKFAYGNGTQAEPYGNGTRPDIPLSCPTSRCVWPVYETLGVCSQCADISDYLTYACITNRVDWTSQLKGGFGVETQYLTAAMCGYFLNATGENPILMSGYLVKANSSNEDEALIMRALPLTNLTSREPLFGNGSIHFKDMRNTLADVLIVAAVNGTADTVYRKVPPIAQECVLSLCVKTIVSTYDSGKYEENIVETHLNTTAGEFPWVGFPYKDESGNGTDIFYMQDININGTTHDGRSISGYGTSNRTAYSIIQGFADIFPSFATTPNTSNISVLRYKIYKEGPAFNRQLVYNPWLYPNVTDHMDRLATAMTNVIRSAPSKIIMTGNAFGKETYIAVYWKWLAFPFILLFLSLVFLVATIIKTSKDREIGVWKTSAMPTLISSLPQEIQPDLTKTSTWRSTSGVEAKRVKIRLMPNQRWRVSGEMRAPASPTFLTRKKNCNPHLVGYEQS